MVSYEMLEGAVRQPFQLTTHLTSIYVYKCSGELPEDNAGTVQNGNDRSVQSMLCTANRSKYAVFVFSARDSSNSTQFFLQSVINGFMACDHFKRTCTDSF